MAVTALRAHDGRDRYRTAAEANTRNRWLILIGLILASIMEILDTTIVNVAQAQMAGNLGATTQDIAWVSTGYILANVVILPMTAFLTARFGRRNYLTASVILFTVSSFFCATSHSLGEIVVWRILQGAGGAALISTAQATLVQVFPPQEQAMVQPLFLMGLVVAPTLGPTVGGWITDAASWHWCFFINVPIGILAAVLVFGLLHDTEPTRADEPVDWTGVSLLTVGIGALQYILEEGERNDWLADPTIARLSLLAGACLIALVFWLLSPRNTHPVIDLRVLKNGSLSAGIIVYVVVGLGMYGVSYLYPLMAQTVEGLSALQTGLAMLPGGIASAVSIVFCGAIASNPKVSLDARGMTLFGIALTTISMAMFARLGPQAGVPDTYWPLMLRGFALGFLFVPVNRLALGSLKPTEVQQGVGLLGLARQLGGSIGIAALATYFSTQTHVERANLVSYVTSTNPAYLERVAGTAGMLSSHGYGPAEAQRGAMALIDQTLMGQALMLAYNHAFQLLMLVSVATIPALLLLKKPKRSAEPAPAMH